MLWSQVYQFFIMYIFGGSYGGQTYDAPIGTAYMGSYGEEQYSVSMTAFKFTNVVTGQEWSYSLGNYLSLIATIISMVAIVLICCALIKKIYNMCAHIIG